MSNKDNSIFKSRSAGIFRGRAVAGVLGCMALSIAPFA